MAEPITIQKLIEASMDSDSLEILVNGDENAQVTTRLGETYPSAKKAIKTMFENGGLPATPFATKALMEASDLVDGKYAVVTDESINSGLYFKEGGIWVKSDYNISETYKEYSMRAVKEVADKLDLLVYNGANLEFINGEATQVGSVGFLKSPDFQRSDYIPITKGEAIRFKGVASPSTPIKGYDADKVFVKDLFVTKSSRAFFDEVIEHEEGISYIIASSAYIASNDPAYPNSSPLIINMQSGVFTSLLTVDKELDINVVNGVATIEGDSGYVENEYYHCSEYIPVIEGAVYTFTGRASRNPIKAYDSNKNFLKDFYVREGVANRGEFKKSVEVSEGIRYLVASSYYKAEPDTAFQEVAPLKVRVSAENPDYTNKLLDYYDDRISELEGMSSELKELGYSVEVLKDIINSSGSSGANGAFRSMSYNIYLGGRNATIRGLIKKHIRRVMPDFMTITEAGDIENLKPILQEFGLNYFYGTGGTYELFFASKTPILYSETVSSVDYARKPLYVELETGKGLIGVLSIHLNSSCGDRPTGPCHVEDYRNVEPWEPQAQQRTIQMYQIMDFFNKRKAENPSLKGFIMQGDYNQAHDEKNLIEYISPINESYLPEGLSYPLPNAQFPEKQFEYYTGDMRIITNPSANGLDYTWWGSDKSPNPLRPNYEIRLDYISYSDDIELVDAEILNSESDSVMPNAGVRKYGEPLAESDSYTASDHAAVIADFIIR